MAPTNSTSLAEFDKKMTTLFTEYTKLAIVNAEKSIQQILQVSASYMSRNAHDALREFYGLYFGDKFTGNDADLMNDSVTNIFEQANQLMAQGKEVDAADIKESEERESQRLGLSGLQKQLETIIALEQGLKNKLIPIFSSMQFEDAMRQRLEHISEAWPRVLDIMRQSADANFEVVANEIADSMSSQQESELYYKTVMHAEAPKAIKERSVWLEFT